MNLPSMSKQELKNLLANAKRLNRDDVALEVLREMASRGIARASDFSLLPWNQSRVHTALQPFAEISKSVPKNQRTAYTEAGGMKIGRSKADPEWKWVDSYSAIKTDKLNAVFVCYIGRPGDDPYFQVHIDGVVERQFEVDDLSSALAHWRALAARAIP